MQLWNTYMNENISNCLLMLSKQKMQPGIVITKKDGTLIPAEKYDAVASVEKGGQIHAFIRIGKLYYGEEGLYYELDYANLYPNDIEKISVCEKWLDNDEKIEDFLKPGMKVSVVARNRANNCKGIITKVNPIEIEIMTADREVQFTLSDVLSVSIK